MHDFTPAEPDDFSNSVFSGQHRVQPEPFVTVKLPAVDLHRNGAIVRVAIMRVAIVRVAIMRVAIMRVADQRVDAVRSSPHVKPVRQAGPRKSFVHHDFHGGQPGFPRRRQRLGIGKYRAGESQEHPQLFSQQRQHRRFDLCFIRYADRAGVQVFLVP